MRVNAVQKSLRNKSSQTTGKGMERALQILRASLELVASEGYGKLSMRGVAARVGVTLGTLQHYYPTREALLEATLLHLLEDLQSAADRIAGEGSKVSPAAQFREAMRYYLQTMRTTANQATFAELRVLALRDPRAADILARVFLRARKSIGRRIKAMAPSVRPKELNERSLLVLEQLMGTFFVSGPRELDDAVLDLMLATARGT